MISAEIKYYCDVCKLNPTIKPIDSNKNSVQFMATTFITSLNTEGKTSNPSAIVKISDKMKQKSWKKILNFLWKKYIYPNEKILGFLQNFSATANFL